MTCVREEHKLKALVIEDDPDGRWQEELSRILRGEGFDVAVAKSCGEALVKLKHVWYDIVTLDLDLGMGKSTEWKMIVDFLRENHPRTSVFIVTGKPDMETAVDAINYYPVNGYFLKGHFHLDVFKTKVREIVGRSSERLAFGGAAIGHIEHLCDKFHLVAKRLMKRHGNRPTLSIKDEYDVQDLLGGFLELYFDDVRAEDVTPIFGGSAGRIDFVLPRERIMVEVKKTRESLADKKIGEQLKVDIATYKKHPDCKTLVCFVYDPEERIRNPAGLTADLELLSTEKMNVRVFIRPLRG